MISAFFAHCPICGENLEPALKLSFAYNALETHLSQAHKLNLVTLGQIRDPDAPPSIREVHRNERP